MQDKSVARQVAPDGSRLGIMPTTSGGVATLPRAPGHERPSATLSGVRGMTVCAPRHRRRMGRTPALPARAPGSDRPCAAPSVPVTDRSRPVQKAPGHGRPPAASSGAAGHDRPRATPRAPGADVPLATTAGVPGQRCPSAAHWARDHFRSRPAPTAPGHDRPLAASSGATRHDRPRATLQAPVQDVPRALAVRVPGSDRPCALAATAAAPDGPHVLHLVPGPDSSHRGPDAGPRPTSLTDPTTPAHDLYSRAYTAEEVQHSSPKPTGRRCSMPRPACSRFLFSASWSRGILPRGASTTAGAVPPSGAGSAPSGSTRSPPSAVPWTCCGACSRTGRRLPRNQRAPCFSYSMKRPSIWMTHRLPPTHTTR